jgi:hypothetical protein
MLNPYYASISVHVCDTPVEILDQLDPPDATNSPQTITLGSFISNDIPVGNTFALPDMLAKVPRAEVAEAAEEIVVLASAVTVSSPRAVVPATVDT